MKKIELLAPAGSWESLEASVKAGADAIYLAGQQFGARKSAQNFTNESLIDAINYCHLRGVKIYLTVNTLLSDDELLELEAFLTPLYEAGMDAFIVQDLGVFKYLRALYPNISLHCSTQMALHNTLDILAVKRLGADRVVLPREMDLAHIEQIHNEVDMDLEVFVHGALCVSVSGQCLMSSLIGGRSGNRGNCAQSCRQKYKLIKGSNDERVISRDGDFLISPRDLMTIDQLKEVIDAGVTSLKIEGRMKSPEYSYAITKAYRTALDAILITGKALTPEENAASKEEMTRLFNRNFTEGFILGTTNKDFISQETPGNRGILVGEVLQYDKVTAEMLLNLFEDITKGDDLQVRSHGNSVGGRVEYLRRDGRRIESAKKDTKILVNFKHEVPIGTQVFRTYDQQLMKDIQLQINSGERTTCLSLELAMKIGEPLKLKLRHESGITTEVSSEQLVEAALKTPLSDERIKEQLEKMGGTPFHVSQIEIEREGNETCPVKILNQLRRDGVELIVKQLSQTWTRDKAADLQSVKAVVLEKTKSEALDYYDDEEDYEEIAERSKMILSAMVRTMDQYKAAAEMGVAVIYIHNLFEAVPNGHFREAMTSKECIDSWIELCTSYPETEAIPYLGRFDYNEVLTERFNLLEPHKAQFKTLLVSSIGQLERARELGYEAVADFSFNVFNHQTCQLLKEEGSKRVTLSLELNDEQIETMLDKQSGSDQRFEIIGYGKMPVMVNQYCPINGAYSKDKENCQICRKDKFYLEDKTGARFLVKGDAHCQVEIFNSAVLNIADEWHKLEAMDIEMYRMNFVDENIDEVNEAIEMHQKAALDFPLELRGKGYTKGHFKRGVL